MSILMVHEYVASKYLIMMKLILLSDA